MIRCQECDSQVAEHDLFCPFCGARVEASAAPGGAAADDSAPTDSDAISEMSTEPDIDDVPMPAILSDLSRTFDNVKPEPTSEFSLESSDDPSAVPEVKEVASENSAPLNAAPSPEEADFE